MTETDIEQVVPKPMERVTWSKCVKQIPFYLTELPWAESGDEITDDIAMRILSAETAEEVLTLTEPIKFEYLVGRRIQVEGFVMRPSDLEDGIGAYALISYTDVDTGDSGITSSGASGILAALARMYQLGSIPFKCNVTEVITSKAGHDNPKYFTHMEESF